MSNAKNIISELINLQRNYANTERCMLTRERYENIFKRKLLTTLDFDDKALREPLIEHIGHLPIVATTLHPYLQNSVKVNLGKTLIILAVHDIGETTVGDVLAYKKTDTEEQDEMQAAKKLLHPSLLKYLQEYIDLESYEAKYAKCVDSLSAILHELDLPEVTPKRFKHFGFDEDQVKDKKRKYFTWDKVLLDIFDYCIDEYKKMLS